jgi:heat shock protein HtpX
MRRRFSTRDAGLSIRMAVTLALVLALYASILAGLAAVYWVSLKWGAVATLLAFIVVVTAFGHITGAAEFLLRRSGARPMRDDPRLVASVLRLSQLADVRTPALYAIDSPGPNAFTVSTRRGRSNIVLTTALMTALEPHELDAVIAHELSHVANHDAAVMTYASVPRTVGETMIGEPGMVSILWVAVWWIGIPLWAIGSLLTLTLSRYREYAADRGSALLTGRPESLASALQKLDGAGHAIPIADLRGTARLEALCIVSSGGTRWSLLRDHPPLEKRLARLGAMAREQGRPVGA